jgi:MarR family transcriptional regulator, 2-MHQ and catechol-resistance regulon repressor
MPTHYQGDPQQVLALDTYIKFLRSCNALEARLAKIKNLEGLTISQFGVLETLYHLGPLTQGQISAKLLKSTGNMTLVLDNLEKQGWVQRSRDSVDRRKITILLTPSGAELIERVFPMVARAITAEMAVLSAQQQTDLGFLCKKLGLQIED